MIKNILILIRPQQWYKNLLIFLPLIFVGKLFDSTALSLTLLGFLNLCIISSTNYIINDIIDKKADQAHPEKKKRPLASGALSLTTAFILALILFVGGITLALHLDNRFLTTALFLFFLTQLYTLILKNILFLDILTIATNFVIRAVAGAFIINVAISPWLVLCTFFLSLYLAVGKRHADALFLGKKAELTRKTLKGYTPELTTSLLTISTTLLIAAYSLYSFLSEHKNLILTIPPALYVILLYYQHITSGDKVARHPEHIFFDKKMLLGILVWGALAIYFLYNAPNSAIWT